MDLSWLAGCSWVLCGSVLHGQQAAAGRQAGPSFKCWATLQVQPVMFRVHLVLHYDALIPSAEHMPSASCILTCCTERVGLPPSGAVTAEHETPSSSKAIKRSTSAGSCSMPHQLQAWHSAMLHVVVNAPGSQLGCRLVAVQPLDFSLPIPRSLNATYFLAALYNAAVQCRMAAAYGNSGVASLNAANLSLDAHRQTFEAFIHSFTTYRCPPHCAATYFL